MSRGLVVFDLDGTLIDSVPAVVADVRACWAALGFPEPEAAAIRRCIGMPWERSLELLLPGAGEREAAMIQRYYAEIADGERRGPEFRHPPAFDGAAALCDALAAEGWRLAVATNRYPAGLSESLDAAGLGGRFVSVLSMGDGPPKPDPWMVRRAMDDAGAAARGTVMVGDTTLDMQAARRAGAAAVGVTWGVHDEDELKEAGAQRIARRFDLLRDLVMELADEHAAR